MTLSSDQAVVINDNTTQDITPADVRTALGYINTVLVNDGTAGTAYGRALLGLADQAALTALIAAATTTLTGAVELATSAETITGTDAVRVVTPAGAAAAYQPLDTDLTTYAAGYTYTRRIATVSATIPADHGMYVPGGSFTINNGVTVTVSDGAVLEVL